MKAQTVASDLARRLEEMERQRAQLREQRSAINKKLQELGQDSDNQRERLLSLRDEVGLAIRQSASAQRRLLDGLPALKEAATNLTQIASNLAEDAALLKRAQEKLQQVAKSIEKVAGLISKVAKAIL